MKIVDVRLLLPADSSFFRNGQPSGDIAHRGWVTKLRVANPMSIYPAHAESRRTWMGPGQEHYAICCSECELHAAITMATHQGLRCLG